MFGHSPYYFSTIRTMVSYFGSCFNDISITRTDDDNNVIQIMKVPLQYSAKDRMLVRPDVDPNIDRPQAISLPRMGFEIIGLNYDGPRKLQSVNKMARKSTTDANKFLRQYVGVPYNIDFNLHIAVKNQEDGLKIVEQILPFFTPVWTQTVNIIPEMDIWHDIPIELQAVGFEDLFDGSYQERRAIIWTMTFTMKTILYGPSVEKPIVKVSKTQFYMGTTVANTITVADTDLAGRLTVKPGLTANGEPTTLANNSIDYNLIEVDDDFGFIVQNEGIIINE